MSILRKANTETVRIPLDDEDWIEVHAEISKRDFNRFLSFMPNREVKDDAGLTAPEAMELQKGMFEALVVAWSLDAPVSVEEYLLLSSEAATAVDGALAKHFQSLTPSKAEEKAGF